MSLFVDESDARERDAADPLASLRGRFYLIPDTIYMDGNSLGLLSRDAETSILHALDQWKRLGIGGYAAGDPSWYYLGEELGALMAPLVGASADEVVATGTTTSNLHSLVTTFYRPHGERRQIVCTDLDFPSDRYALASDISLLGGDPARDLIAVPSRDGRFVDEDAIIAALTDDVALAVLPSVLYRSGQLLDIARLTAAAHARGIAIGFDCAHSVGAIPHEFDKWGVDFAFWCGYKYLNGGPGGLAGLYVNRQHHAMLPALRGWWGYDKTRQFDMDPDFVAAGTAGSWQLTANPLFSAAALRGSLAIIGEIGMPALRTRSLALTDYLITLLDDLAPLGYTNGTPRANERRGGHIAVEHPEAARITKALKARGVVPDFRTPNVIRLAPIALYTSYHDIWQTMRHLAAIVETGEYATLPPGRDLIA